MKQRTTLRSSRPILAVVAIGVVLGVLMLAWPVRVEMAGNAGDTVVVDCGPAWSAAMHRPSYDAEVAPGIDESGAWFHCGPDAVGWVFAGGVVVVASALGGIVAIKRRRRLEGSFPDA
jgi:hypothetical protein